MSSQAPVIALGRQPAARATLIDWARVLGQMVLLTGVWFVADRVAALLHLPVSGGVLGLLVLVALLLSGLVKPPLIEKGAEWLLANMLLYFIPLVVSIVQYTSLIQSEGLKLFLAIGIGFISVMLATALTVEWVCALTRKRTLRRHLQRRRAHQLARIR
ncbi:CidA/LrgA family protein [Pseudomonas sp. dw_358]|uniref:CidA/LrgA family protein n=1 Tax=Pseudomonas sp. dw_358 TaxID=2720083 RepID=UPI001BD5D1B9|nr:CidA/LrgA family protein [Pseudomonas sp. dw_358]